MSKLHLISTSLKSGVALLPVAVAFAHMPAQAQAQAQAQTQAQASASAPASAAAPATNASPATPAKTREQLEAEAKAAAVDASDAAAVDDAALRAARAEERGSTVADGKDIVVTGTSIRGAVATGTNEITVTREEIEATGANSGTALLASIPQISGGFFNDIPQLGALNANAVSTLRQSTIKPSLRQNPNGSTDSGNSTLILVDGARTSGVGVNSSAQTPDTVPPALLERVELNTDGGSSIYGSDAIGGVINFVTRKKFDGVQIGGHYGYADKYQTWDATGIVGKDWGTTSAYVSYTWAGNTPLFQRDRDFVREVDFSTPLELQRGLNCETPNLRVPLNNGVPIHHYALTPTGRVTGASFTQGVGGTATAASNLCTPNRNASLASKNRRHNVLASFYHEFSPDVKLSVRARYAKNRQEGFNGPQTFNINLAPGHPYYNDVAVNGGLPPADVNSTAPLTYVVLGNFFPALGIQNREYASFSTQYGSTAELSWNIDENFQFRGLINVDQSRSGWDNGAYNAAAITAASANNCATATPTSSRATHCINPFNVAATDPALLQSFLNFEDLGKATNKILNFKGTVDGALFQLPAGKVRMAVGLEYRRDRFNRGNASGVPPLTIALQGVTQINESAFGELNIPLVSSANAMPLVKELRLALSGRYDHYSDFGSTFNPRIGASYKPANWLTLRGNWSKSFRAPTTVDILRQSKANTTASIFPLSVVNALDPTRPVQTGQTSFIALQGTSPDIQPQKGRAWSVAAEVTPVRGLRASVSYYHTFYIGTLAAPITLGAVFPTLGYLATVYPTLAQCQAFVDQAGNGNTISCPTVLPTIYELLDARTRNLGNTKVGGIDYSIRYNRPVSFGSIFASVSGNVFLENQGQATPASPYVNNLRGNNSLHRLTAQLGMTSGGFRSQLTLNHADGFRVTPNANRLQSKIGAYNVVNLFASYDFQGDSFMERGLQLSLSIANLFDQDPPLVRGGPNSGNGFGNGNTLGRLVQLGIEKKF